MHHQWQTGGPRRSLNFNFCHDLKQSCDRLYKKKRKKIYQRTLIVWKVNGGVKSVRDRCVWVSVWTVKGCGSQWISCCLRLTIRTEIVRKKKKKTETTYVLSSCPAALLTHTQSQAHISRFIFWWSRTVIMHDNELSAKAPQWSGLRGARHPFVSWSGDIVLNLSKSYHGESWGESNNNSSTCSERFCSIARTRTLAVGIVKSRANLRQVVPPREPSVDPCGTR